MSTFASSPKYVGIARTYAEVALWLLPPLLAANLLISIDIAARRSVPVSPREPDTVITQADKLFSIMKNYGDELQMVASIAAYPDDNEKQKGQTAVRRFAIDTDLARLALARLDERRDRDSMLEFLAVACGETPDTGNCATLVPPPFSHMEPGLMQGTQYVPGKVTQYANTSRLESLHDDFVVLLAAMLKDAR
ncbi:MAG: hypothetical protein WBF42_07130 [Terracidiphilus sp.]